MNHSDHVWLLRRGVPAGGGVWADLGAGSGAFTLALAELLGDGATIYAVDRDGRALTALARSLYRRYPAIDLQPVEGDFTQPLVLPPLDGIVMANSLHFVEAKAPVLDLLRGYLRPGGRLLIVEYNTDRGNHWVPHPFSFASWQRLGRAAGFAHIELLATRPSTFLGEFYAAASW